MKKNRGNRSLSVTVWMSLRQLIDIDRVAQINGITRSMYVYDNIDMALGVFEKVESMEIIKSMYLINNYKKQWKDALCEIKDRDTLNPKDIFNEGRSVSLSIKATHVEKLEEISRKMVVSRSNLICYMTEPHRHIKSILESWDCEVREAQRACKDKIVYLN